MALAKRHRDSEVFVEKAVDVILAVDMVVMAERGEYETAKEERGGGACHLRAAVLRKNPNETGLLGVPKLHDTGFVDAYVCAACGYTEFWSHGLEDLVANPDDGIHFIETAAPRGQPLGRSAQR